MPEQAPDALAIGERNRARLELIKGWATLVLEFQAQNERPESFPEEQRWGPNELLVVWKWREDLQEYLGAHDEVDAGSREILTVIDEYFKTLSVRGADTVYAAFDCELPGPREEAPWWWARIPKSGPVLDELLKWCVEIDCDCGDEMCRGTRA